MATYTPKRLAGPAQLTTSAGSSLYTPSTGATGVIKEIVLANTSSSSTAVTVYLVPSGSSTGAATTLVPGITLAGNSFVAIPLSQVINNSENIYASATVGSSVTLTISGVEFA